MQYILLPCHKYMCLVLFFKSHCKAMQFTHNGTAQENHVAQYIFLKLSSALLHTVIELTYWQPSVCG